MVHGPLPEVGDGLQVLPLLLRPLRLRAALTHAPGLELYEKLALVRLDLPPVQHGERVGQQGDVVAMLGVLGERTPEHLDLREPLAV